MSEGVEKNMIDKDEYPQTAELERRCVHMLSSLWNRPDHHMLLDDIKRVVGKLREGVPLHHGQRSAFSH